jgi:hypothetical protein
VRLESHEPEALVIQSEFCLHADLSTRGTMALLHAVKTCLDDSSNTVLATNLSDLVQEILTLANVDLTVALEEFGTCIQQWCPILPEDNLRGGTNDLSQQMFSDRESKNPLLWLCLWLITKRTCLQQEHVTASELYRTMKQIAALMQSRRELHVEVVQIGMIIAAYEVGHGLQTPACQTLASCIALLRALSLDARRKKDMALVETTKWLKVSMLMLDRYVPRTQQSFDNELTYHSMIPISMTADTLSLTLFSNDPISKAIASSMDPEIPAPAPRPYASSPRKVHIRATVSLASGHVQEYIHARHHELDPEETYDQVDETINTCIQKLVDKPQPHTWLHCDAIAMAFWYGPYCCFNLSADMSLSTNILLQAAHMQYLDAVHPNPQELRPPTAMYIKAHLALKYSRRMAWDMVRVAIQKIQSAAEIPHLPFAGLCCVLRAGLAVLETRTYVNEDVVGEDEVQGFKQILEWFADRWGIGSDYLKRLEELLG